MDDATIRREAQRLLRSFGPMAAVELALQLSGDGSDAAGRAASRAEASTAPTPEDVHAALMDISVEGAEFLAFPLSDGRLCDVDELFEGLTLTHVLTEDERRDRTLSLEVDLCPLLLLSSDGRSYPLADGEVATFGAAARWHLTGPEGWLPDAPVVVAQVVDGRIALTGRDATPPPDAELAERLEAVLAAEHARKDVVDEVELVIAARARYPRLLRTAQAPLSELLGAVGISSTEHGLRRDDEPWDEDAHAAEIDELIDHLVEDHELGDDEVALVLAVLTDLARLDNHVLDAAIPRARERGPEHALDLDVLARDEASRTELAALTADALLTIDLEAAAERFEAVLAETHLTAVVIEDVVGSGQLDAACLRALLEACRPQASGRMARANLSWLRAKLLELVADDHADVERELRHAYEVDDGNVYVALDLVGYLADRGQAGAALGILRRIDGLDLEGYTDLLERFAAPGPTSAGRNEPCPCGSGRKHKACCQARNGWPLQERVTWLWDKVRSFLISPSASHQVDLIAQLVGVPSGPEAAEEVAVGNLALFEGGLLEEMLARRGSLLPADERDLLAAWTRTRAAAYELVEVAAGARMTLLDLRSGDRFAIVDHSLSRAGLPVGSALLAWVVPEPEGYALSIGVVRVPDERRERLLDLLDQEPSARDLAAWYRSLSAPPHLATTAGDPLLFTTLVYAVEDVEAARAALAPHLEPDGDRLIAFEERSGERWLRGGISFDEKRLIVRTTSAARAAWFSDLLTEVVPDAELTDVERLTSDDLAADGVDGDLDPEESGSGALDLDALDPSDRQALEEQLEAMMRRHEDSWLDTPLPALKGATPREAADDPTRREALERLLDEFDAAAARWSSPGRPMDAGRLRHLLEL